MTEFDQIDGDMLEEWRMHPVTVALANSLYADLSRAKQRLIQYSQNEETNPIAVAKFGASIAAYEDLATMVKGDR